MSVAVLVAVTACLSVPGAAQGAGRISDGGKYVTLKVNKSGRAVVGYTYNGVRRNVVIWGAINARHPSQTRKQVRFQLDYSGGWAKFGFPVYTRMKNACRPYDGPKLPWLVKACKAPDGSYWAIQSFKRLMPNLGLSPWLPRHRLKELYVSHWKGPVARLEVYADWVQSVRWHELFGRLTYKGVGVYGWGDGDGTGAPSDSYQRLIYLDTYNSALGPGWKRENSFLARRKYTPGHFCYHFVPRDRYASYPPGPRRPPAHGDRYRLTAHGPGVTPFVIEYVKGLADFDASNPEHLRIEAEMNALKPSIVGGDPGCQNN